MLCQLSYDVKSVRMCDISESINQSSSFDYVSIYDHKIVFRVGRQRFKMCLAYQVVSIGFYGDMYVVNLDLFVSH